jgi:SAM-dependent methyltransferase
MRGATRDIAPEDVLADLIDFHTDRPGITEATLGGLTTTDGKTGYDILVEGLRAEGRCVLELGCGNGPMVERLSARVPPLERVIGLDACGPEIERARARVGDDNRIDLRVARGDDTGLEGASVDAVISHHALYLFVPIEPVIAEIARVLRPGGDLSFVTLSQAIRDPLFDAMMQDFGALTRRDNPHFSGWGDRRMWSREGLESLFGRDFELPYRVDDFVVSVEEPADALCERLMRFFYSVELQRSGTQDELRAAWTARLAATAQGGIARFALPSARITLRRR